MDIITLLFVFPHLCGEGDWREGEERRMDELVNRWIATLAQVRLIRYLN